MTKANEDMVDPVTNDDALAETPRETLDPVPDRVACDLQPKPKRQRKPSMKRKARAEG